MSTRETIGNAIAAAINRAVALDPDARRRLRRLDGRAVGIELSGLELAFALRVEAGRFTMGNIDTFAPDARIRATPGAFVALASSRGRAAAGQVELSGDTETARRFQQFFQELKPDFEEALSGVFGDVIGVQLSRILGGGARWARDSSRRFAEDVSEYLREESRQLVTAPEMEQFLDQVDDLRDDVERLAARIARLQTR